MSLSFSTDGLKVVSSTLPGINSGAINCYSIYSFIYLFVFSWPDSLVKFKEAESKKLLISAFKMSEVYFSS